MTHLGRLNFATRDTAVIVSVVSKPAGGSAEYLIVCATFSDRMLVIASVRAATWPYFQAPASASVRRKRGS
jgi:hypothetical protein